MNFFLFYHNIFTVIYVLECLGTVALSLECYRRFACSPVPFQTFKLSRDEWDQSTLVTR